MTTVVRAEAEPLPHAADDALVTVADTSVLDARAEPLHALGDAFAQLTVHCRIGTGRDDPHGVGVELLTAKPIWVWKYRGRVAGTPIAEDVDGWRSLSVFHTEGSLHWRPFQSRLLTALRKAGAAGATVVRGRLAYVFDAPLRPRHGWFARSEAPTMIRVVDTRDRVARWIEIVDELTGDGGLVTCEPVRILGRG